MTALLVAALWTALVLAALTAAGALAQRAFGGKARWAARGPWHSNALAWLLLGLGIAYVVSMGSAIAVALICAVLLAVRAQRAGAPASADAPHGPRRWQPWAVAAALLAAWVFARPLVPLAWDEFVWLTKARIEGKGGWGALTAAALVRGRDVFPSGYPLLWSLLPAWLVATDDVPALVMGFGVAKLVCLAAFGWALWRQPPLHRFALALGAVALLSPLFFEHLRLLYADAPVGLLSAALTLHLLQAARDADRPSARAAFPDELGAAIAIVVTGVKDEGAAHVAAIAATALILGGRAMRLQALTALAAAAVTTITWRLSLRAHGIVNSDHALNWPAFDTWPTLAAAALAHALDPLSWGVLWPLVLVAAVALLFGLPRATADAAAWTNARESRFVAAAWLAQLCVLQIGLQIGPERVRIFALNGTLFNRMLVQLTPAAAIVLCAAASRWLPRASSTTASEVSRPLS